jgi:hypothetical protein
MSDEACYADDIGDYRWEGFPLEAKVAWMQTGQGSAAVQPGVDALRGMSARYAESHKTVKSELAKLGISWQGQSADAAAGAVTQIADWVAGAGRTVSGGGGSMGTYASSFDAMKPKIQPVPVTARPVAGPPGLGDGIGALAGFQTDFSRQVEMAAAADAQANAALSAHQRVTRAALASFPPVDPPPAVAAGAVFSASANGVGGNAMGAGAGGGAPTSRAGGSPGGSASAGGAPPAPAGTGAGSAPTGGPGAGVGARWDHGAATAAAGAGAPTTDAAWTPLTPRASDAGSGGLVTGPNGGLVPSPPVRPPLLQAPIHPDVTGRGRFGGPGGPGGFGSRGGLGEGFGPPPAPRTGAGQMSPRVGGDFGVPQSAPGRGTGPAGGAAPMGMGGAGRGGQERTHRNQTFIPSDDPFRVEFFDVTRPVLGLRGEEAW